MRKSDFIFSNRIAEKNQVNKNVKIVKKIIKFCKNCKVERVFFFSSSAIYSIKNKLPYRENQTINPNNSLGKSKYRSEKILWHCPSCKSWESIRPLQRFQFEKLMN